MTSNCLQTVLSTYFKAEYRKGQFYRTTVQQALASGPFSSPLLLFLFDLTCSSPCPTSQSFRRSHLLLTRKTRHTFHHLGMCHCFNSALNVPFISVKEVALLLPRPIWSCYSLGLIPHPHGHLVLNYACPLSSPLSFWVLPHATDSGSLTLRKLGLIFHPPLLIVLFLFLVIFL